MAMALESLAGEEGLRLLQEHLRWEENRGVMYDVFRSEEIDWPSLTVQWLPGVSKPAEEGQYTVQRLLLGTQTSGAEQEYLLVADVLLPAVESDCDDDEDTAAGDGRTSQANTHAEDDDEENEDCIGGYSKRLPHDGEVNRARYMPQNPSLVATKAGGGKVFLFDLDKPLPAASASSSSSMTSTHQAVLEGSLADGYALAWSPYREGDLLSGDTALCYWNVATGSREGTLQPLQRDTETHGDLIEDVAWLSADCFATVADDCALRTWDPRARLRPAATVKYTSHLNALGYSALAEHRLLTGAQDGLVLQWDLRLLSSATGPVRTFKGHDGEVFSVQCAPFLSGVFASAGVGREVVVWDIDRPAPAAEEGDEDGPPPPPEIVFKHAGHTGRIWDVAWNPNADEAWVAASVQEGPNLLHVWKPNQDVLVDDDNDAPVSGAVSVPSAGSTPPSKRPRV